MASQDTNFRLSETEIQLLEDTSFFDKKRRVLGNVESAFGNLEKQLVDESELQHKHLPDELTSKRGKISRGDNLLGLPWMVLDCPSYFSRDAVFAFRTLFWWGHPFSMTLHLSGRFAASWGKNLIGNFDKLEDSLLFCINTRPFVHHYGTDNYMSVGELRLTGLQPESQLKNHGFIKIAKTLPLREAETMIAVFGDHFRKMLGLMQ